ncbi:MAG: hypothetical protein LBE49_06675, partial [Deltaproteobacteria bacterium]|nr:hypothetical protein [Deltaproteobacteria bacterium]
SWPSFKNDERPVADVPRLELRREGRRHWRKGLSVSRPAQAISSPPALSNFLEESMEKPPVKVFNTAGSCKPSDHYMLPVLPRLPEVEEMIEGKYYSLPCLFSTLSNITDRHEAIITI